MYKSLLKKLTNSHSVFGQTISNHIENYPTPINFNYMYSFGSLVGLFFAIQLITGIFLAMHYVSGLRDAFSSVVHIMVDVQYGYVMRYAHSNGASMIFILLYIHISRGLYYRSYTYHRRYLWWSGLIIFFLMMATGFIGYVLPWGQMSFWGATVITNLLTAIPFVGENIAHWIWGGFSVGNPTLVRFFSIHYLLPFLITGIIIVHLVLLHQTTSTHPLQTVAVDKIPFHPYYTIKDTFAFSVALLVFIWLVFFAPNLLGHPDNYIPANPLVTPPHIVPEWYFTPFYAILRAFPNKLGGVVAMLAAILILFVLPFYPIDNSCLPPSYSPLHNFTFFNWFLLSFFLLLWLGGKPAASPYIELSRIASVFYFSYFIIIIPLVPLLDTIKIYGGWRRVSDYYKLFFNISKEWPALIY